MKDLYHLVQWPISQMLMEHPRFNECLLVQDIDNHDEVGSSAYMCPSDLYAEIFNEKQMVYVVEYYDFDSVSGEGNLEHIIDVYGDLEEAIEVMKKEYAERKKAFVEEWLPDYSDQLKVEDFEEEITIEYDTKNYYCQYINERHSMDGIGVRVLQYELK